MPVQATFRLPRGMCCAAFTVFLLLAGAAGHAQTSAAPSAPAGSQAGAQPGAQSGQGRHRLPITTGTSKTSMDAPEQNSQLEKYAHSPVVQSVARHLGLSTGTAARIFEDFNSGVLIAAILYFLLRYLPGKYKEKRQTVEQDLVRARQATADSEARLKRVEAKLASLGGEVKALRRQAEESSKSEEARMRRAMEAERERIVRSAEAEIAAAEAQALRGLKRYASDLAVDRAAARVRLSPEGDRALVDGFLEGLGSELSRQGRN